MRILFLSTWHPYPPDNGSKIRVNQLLRALSERHAVSLVAFEFGSGGARREDSNSALLEAIETVTVNPFEVNKVSAIRRFASMKPVSARPIAVMEELVSRMLDDGHFDTVIASGEVMAGYALRGRPGRTVALELHNSMGRWMWERYRQAPSPPARLRNWVSWQKTKRYEKKLFSRFDLVTMVSEQDRAFSAKRVHEPAAPVHVIPNGVDCEWNRPGLVKGAANVVVYSGAMTYRANYDAVCYFLREIYPLVKLAVPDVTFKVTGSTTGVALSGLELDETVTLTGYVDDVRREVAAAAVSVIPLREGGGTRLKLLEALALGTPVVSTSKGAEGLAVKHGEHVLIADEPAQFAQETARLLGDEDLRNRLAINGRRLVETMYDWRKLGREYAELIETVTAEQK